ncbi:unnamed protein product [Cuscuta epithymum]|uniref:DUF868 family protein n=1 Tax=Cuscuta epithymum TaxID=186058 RepID=A0AAV0E902_9ASTE|nr:unnamed protein product [Cuscuta epithymum]CAH9119960.1 unnamed protein product [Cuscuta epithymum]
MTMLKFPWAYLAASMNQRDQKVEAEEKEESGTIKPAAQSFVTCIHLAKIADLFRTITVTWSKTLINHTLFIIVENPSEDNHYTCKIDLKTWQFWGKKGLKSFKVDEVRVDVYWDLRAAKFSSSPEPVSDYYVALSSRGEVVILLGDQKNEAFKRSKSRPSLVDATLVHKKESVYAKRCFCTRTMLGKGKREHNIIIETNLSGGDPEMWITVDGMDSIRVVNLNWRFRGNEIVMVDDVPVDVFWDVHDWVFSDDTISAAGPGIFIFKQGNTADQNEVEEANSHSNGQIVCDKKDCDDSQTTISEFCHVFYAWKTE